MQHKHFYGACAAFSLALILLGLLLDDPRSILPGFWTILSSQDVLITDYVALAGPGAAFCNAGLVALFSLAVKALAREPLNGSDFVDMGLMSGFALFGKNIVNIWPIIFGAWLFSRLKHERFGRFASVALLATSLSPLVSFGGLNTGWNNPLLGVLLGMLVGFAAVPLSDYTYRIQNGMSLYNMGFACGLLAMVIVPLMTAVNRAPTKADYWAAGYNLPLGVFLGALCAALLAAGFALGGRGAAKGYLALLRTSGRAPSDYLRMFGLAATLINMGVNGAFATAFILLTGGDLNGPTVGCIFTVIGFSAAGKHIRNILPIMLGVLLGSLVMHFSINDPAVQMASLLCTTLAPFAGCFGWPFGLLAGFLHSALVLEAGSVVQGVNLYNNGFSGGLLAMVLYPIITSLFYHRRAVLQDKDYLEQFVDETPVSPEEAERSHSQDIDMPY